jgi:hypothetical protein
MYCTSKHDPCVWEVDYSPEKSMIGNVFQDVMSIGGLTTRGRIGIGAIYQVRNSFFWGRCSKDSIA